MLMEDVRFWNLLVESPDPVTAPDVLWRTYETQKQQQAAPQNLEIPTVTSAEVHRNVRPHSQNVQPLAVLGDAIGQ